MISSAPLAVKYLEGKVSLTVKYLYMSNRSAYARRAAQLIESSWYHTEWRENNETKTCIKKKQLLACLHSAARMRGERALWWRWHSQQNAVEQTKKCHTQCIAHWSVLLLMYVACSAARDQARAASVASVGRVGCCLFRLHVDWVSWNCGIDQLHNDTYGGRASGSFVLQTCTLRHYCAIL